MELARARSLRLCGLLAGLWSVGYLAVLSSDTGGRTAVVAAELGKLLAAAVAALACALTARRTGGRLRRSWLLFGAFAAVWSLGQLAWCWYVLVLDVTVPFPGLPDVGYLASVPLVLAALLVHPDAPPLAAGRLRLVADAVLVGVSLLALTWRFAVRDVYLDAGAHGFAAGLGLVYPALDAIVLTLLALVAFRARGRGSLPLALVAGCLAWGAAGHLVYGVVVQSGSWRPGSPVDAAWGIGFVFLALAACSESAPQRTDIVERAASLRSAFLPFLPLAGVVLFVVVDQVKGQTYEPTGRALGGVIFAAVLARQLLALVENSRLTRNLEATVAERTRALQLSSDKLQEQAWTDALTGLPNRARTHDLVARAVAQGPLVVALLDLDGFKTINDSLGHAAGDELLTAVGELLVTGLSPGAVVGRLGGDEFVVALPGCVSDLQARAFGAEVLRALGCPVLLGARSLVMSGSLGLAVARPGDTAESLLRNADLAMYAAKHGGKDRLQLFEPAMRDRLLARVELEHDLRTALIAGQVVPWFQPVVDLRTGQIRGVEALARWQRDGTQVPPSVFVPLAEQTGLVALLGRQILRTSCTHAAAWNRLAPLTLSVNLSAVQLASDDLVDVVREALRESGLAPEQLVLEITETVLMDDVAAAGEQLAALRALGIRIALDDFGTGYSALGYLQQIPVDIVKIDRAFVRELHLGPRQGALASAVLTLAASLELEVIAEGVELPAQAERLRQLGCRLAQGLLYQPALPATELGQLWHRQLEDSVENSR
ncbi:MAG: hypothetical protein JWN55_1467 [Frankiales bacterium]|nr:hypothetical protein [Frankiales bacterium]